jgi:predicted nucleotidyltransferase component of viral defense system
MLAFSEIIKQYPPSLQGFGRFIIREYLQYKILQIVFNSEYANKLSFLGGTCLRIVYGNTRFSEDLDFDNFNLSENDFDGISVFIAKELAMEGYEVETRVVHKGAFHCYIKFPELLYRQGLSNVMEEKILIQLDTEAQHFPFQPEKIILNKFDVFTQINTTPLDLLLAQKFYAIINRKRNKGRDFFDVVFLLSKIKSPNYDYLNEKINTKNAKQLKELVLQKCSTINMDEMAKDVAPFLFNPADLNKIKFFIDYLKQVEL